MKSISNSWKRFQNKLSQHPVAEVDSILQIQVQVCSVQDIKKFDQLLKKEHYLGKGRPAGDYLRQVVIEDGKWVGLLTWGSACYRIKDRDQWIGWTHTQRAERLKLVVQNRRFLLLTQKGKEPNLASKVLGACVRVLAAQWKERFGYEPVLAETFTDIEQFHGTCYKAAGWQPVGVSQGYARHRADFYVRHDHPKKLWLKELRADAREILTGGCLPQAQSKGGHSNAHGVMPMKEVQYLCLSEALEKVLDSRESNTQFPMGSLLCVVAMALLSGYYQISQILRFGNRLTQAQRKELGFPRRKKTQYYRMPCYNVYYQVLKRIDPDQFAGILNQWLEQNRGSLPSALALDGKMIRQTIGVVTLADHESGVPAAMSLMSEKEGEGDHCEMKSGQRLLETMKPGALDGQLITADPLHAQKLTAQIIVKKGGDYLLQIKGNQPKLLDRAQKMFQDAPFLQI